MTQPSTYSVPSDVNFGDQAKDSNPCNDWGCAIFFLIQFFGTIALFGYFINEYRKMNIQYWNFSFRATPGFIGLLIASGAVGAIIGFVLTCLIRRFPSKAIIVSILGVIVLYAAFGIFLIIFKAILAGVLIIVFGCGFTLLFLFCVRKRIKFSAKLVKYSVKAILASWGIYFVAFANLVISFLYSLWWIVGSLSLISVVFQRAVDAGGYDNANDGRYVGIWIALAFPLFLTTETFQHIVHFVVCGVTASFWFSGNGERNVTMASLKRATVFSLGTVVFGSTITSLLRTARFAIRAFANDRSIIAACALCLLKCIENLVRFFNVYAFAWASIYGDNYCKSAKNTMEILTSKGFTVIINDELVGLMLMACGLACGIIGCGVIGSIYYWAISKASIGPFFFAFGISYVTGSIFLVQIYSAVVATIVTWASAPEAMQANHPEYYQKIEKARHKMYH